MRVKMTISGSNQGKSASLRSISKESLSDSDTDKYHCMENVAQSNVFEWNFESISLYKSLAVQLNGMSHYYIQFV